MRRKLKPTPKTIKITIREDDLKRLAAMATRSGVTIARFAHGALMAAVYSDEAHWEEVDRGERYKSQFDRATFARISRLHLANLPPTVVDLLVDLVAREHEKGMQRGAEIFAETRLARVKGQ